MTDEDFMKERIMIEQKIIAFKRICEETGWDFDFEIYNIIYEVKETN